MCQEDTESTETRRSESHILVNDIIAAAKSRFTKRRFIGLSPKRFHIYI